jgi:hypothetical protein
MMLFKHARFPRAAKAFLTFMMEHPQFDDLLEGAVEQSSHMLKAYGTNPVWTSDSKHVVFREAAARFRSFACKGKLGYAAAAALSYQIVLEMFSEAASGQLAPTDVSERAERRVDRYCASRRGILLTSDISPKRTASSTPDWRFSMFGFLRHLHTATLSQPDEVLAGPMSVADRHRAPAPISL